MSTGDIKVGSFDGLSSGSKDIRKTGNNLKELLERSQSVENLHQDRIFAGPLADHVDDMWRIIKKATKNNINTYTDSANNLDYINSSYKQVDSESAKQVRDIL